MATDDDVILFRVPEFTPGWLPVGLHPIPGVLTLATEEEVSVAEVAPNPAWPTWCSDLRSRVRRLASAVGEGAITFQLVHEYFDRVSDLS